MKRLTIVLIVLIISLFTFQGLAEDSSSNETVSEPIVIDLDKGYFKVGEKLSGNVILNLSEYVDSEENLEIILSAVFDSVEDSMTLEDVLSNLSLAYTLSEEKLELGESAESKTLSFLQSGEKSLGVRLPQYSNIESVDMSISAPAESELHDVKIDVLNDGEIDWYYLGEMLNWEEEYHAAEDFVEPAMDIKKLVDNETYYCQIIDFPYSIDYEVTAEYKKTGEGGDIKAILLTYDDPLYPESASAECDLPEQETTSWSSCSISTDYGLAGENLVCVYSSLMDEGNELYSVQVDSAETDTAYRCTRDDEGLYSCQKALLSDYAIKVRGATYDKVLNSDIDFGQWQYSPESILWALRKYVGSSEPADFTPVCQELQCPIEFKFIANGSGPMTLSNLDIEYDSVDGPGEINHFFNIEKIPPKILEIGTGNETTDINETGYTLRVPLSLFNLTVPESFDSDNLEPLLTVSFADEEEESTFNVIGKDEMAGSELLIHESQEAWDSMLADSDKAKILEMLGKKTTINEAKSGLSTYSERLSSGDSDELQQEIIDYRADYPKQIVFETSLIDLAYIEPDDITSDIVPREKRDETYFFQENVKVKASLSSFVIRDYSGASTNYTWVKKEVTANTALSKVDVYEIIEKDAAYSVEDIYFQATPSSIVKKDPIVKWFISSLPSGSTEEFNYVVEGDAPFSLSSVKTVVVKTEEEEEEEEPEAVCGDGVCTSILEDEVSCPEDCEEGSNALFWTIFIILIFIIAGGIFYVYKFKGGFSGLLKKFPFSNKQELESLLKYIKNSQSKKISDVQIRKRLLDKGWEKKQVEYAFEELKKDSVDIAPMKKYIEKALAKNKDKKSIAKKLISQGWDEKAVKKELGLK